LGCLDADTSAGSVEKRERAILGSQAAMPSWFYEVTACRKAFG